MTNDAIADLLTQIRNASMSRKGSLELPSSVVKESLCVLLKKHGFIADFKKFKESGKPYKSLHIDLKYFEDGRPVASFLRRVSTPGARYYAGFKDLPISKGGKGLVVVSTPRGLMNSLEAKKKHLGGEVWAEIY